MKLAHHKVILCALAALGVFLPTLSSGQNAAVALPPTQGNVATSSWNLSQAPRQGSPNALVNIIMFLNYQCPYSAQLFDSVQTVRNSNASALSVTVLHFPLDASCNPQAGSTMHPNACLGAAGAICAQEQGHFWDVSATLFRSHASLSRAVVDGAAQTGGLDMGRFATCMAGTGPTQHVAHDAALAAQVPVQGTPMMIVNGRIIQGAIPTDQIRAVVKHLADSGGVW